MFISCTLSAPSGDQQPYTFEFKPDMRYLLWVEGTQVLDVTRNTDSQLWATHSGKYRPFAYDHTSFQLNRATGEAELSYSRTPTNDEVTSCKNGHNFGCDAWIVLTEHTEVGLCEKQTRRI